MDYFTEPVCSPFSYISLGLCLEDLPGLETVDTNPSLSSSLTSSFTSNNDQSSGHEGVYPETLWLNNDTIRPFAGGNLESIDSLLADIIEENAEIHMPATTLEGRQIQRGYELQSRRRRC